MPTKLSLAHALDIYEREELDRLVADKGAEAWGLWPPDYNEFKKILPELFRRLTVVDRREGAMAGVYWDFDNYDDSARYACEINAARKKGLPDSVVEPPEPPDFIPDPDLPRLRGVTITVKGRATIPIRRKARKLLEAWLLEPKPGNIGVVRRRLAERELDLGRNAYFEILRAARGNVGDGVHPTWETHVSKATTTLE